MTLANMLRKSLHETPAAGRRHEIQVAHPETGWTAEVVADRRDDLSCLTWEIRLLRPAPAPNLKSWADQVAHATSGLLEKLQLHEVDDGQGIALLRSKDPASLDDQVLYFEMELARGGAMTLRRYQADRRPGQRRRQVAYPLTNEALVKVVESWAEGAS